MPTLPLAEVKNRLSEVVSELVANHDRVVVTRNGRPAAVILSPDDLESLEEAVAVLSDRDLVRQLVDSRADVAAGRVHDMAELDAAMATHRPGR
jgi:antitoxin YefM